MLGRIKGDELKTAPRGYKQKSQGNRLNKEKAICIYKTINRNYNE